jgi:hypothetical protein
MPESTWLRPPNCIDIPFYYALRLTSWIYSDKQRRTHLLYTGAFIFLVCACVCVCLLGTGNVVKLLVVLQLRCQAVFSEFSLVKTTFRLISYIFIWLIYIISYRHLTHSSAIKLRYRYLRVMRCLVDPTTRNILFVLIELIRLLPFWFSSVQSKYCYSSEHVILLLGSSRSGFTSRVMKCYSDLYSSLP